MPHAAWSNKRERQYEHIKSGIEPAGQDPNETQNGLRREP